MLVKVNVESMAAHFLQKKDERCNTKYKKNIILTRITSKRAKSKKKRGSLHQQNAGGIERLINSEHYRLRSKDEHTLLGTYITGWMGHNWTDYIANALHWTGKLTEADPSRAKLGKTRANAQITIPFNFHTTMLKTTDKNWRVGSKCKGQAQLKYISESKSR